MTGRGGPLLIGGTGRGVALPSEARWWTPDDDVGPDAWIVEGAPGLGAVPPGAVVLVLDDGGPPPPPSEALSFAPTGPWRDVAVRAFLARVGRARRIARTLRHDVFSPLAIVSGHLDLLDEPTVGPLTDRQRGSVVAMRGAVERMTRELDAIGDAGAGALWSGGRATGRLAPFRGRDDEAT